MSADKRKIFFCYSRADSEFAIQLAHDLRQAGANVWIDQLDIAAGDAWDIATEKALEDCERLLFILSPSSVQSREVRSELNYALEERKPIVPVLYKECSVPYRLRLLQRIDFTSDYNQALSALLKLFGIAEQAEQEAPLPVKKEPPKASPKTREPKKTDKARTQKPPETDRHAAPQLYTFRKTPATLSTDDVMGMLQERGFYDSGKNATGQGIGNVYEEVTQEGKKLVIDHSTKLTWQQSGSKKVMTFADAQKYVSGLNDNSYAGYDDWRLPTLEEAMSLMEPQENSDGLYIDAVFDSRQTWIWTADKEPASAAWYVGFGGGLCFYGLLANYGYVRAVR